MTCQRDQVEEHVGFFVAMAMRQL